MRIDRTQNQKIETWVLKFPDDGGDSATGPQQHLDKFYFVNFGKQCPDVLANKNQLNTSANIAADIRAVERRAVRRISEWNELSIEIVLLCLGDQREIG